MVSCFHQNPNSLIRALVTAALLLAVGPGALAHEVSLIPMRGSDDKDSLLPVVLPGAHLAISPSALDFGPVVIGQSATRTVELSNVSSDDLAVAAAVEPPFSVAPAGPFALASGAPPVVLSVTFTPTDAGDLADSLLIASEHDGVGVAEIAAVAVTGTAAYGPEFKLQIAGRDESSYDFGKVPRRPRASLEDVPRFFLDIVNVGDMPGDFNIFLGPGFAGDTCSPRPSPLCIAGHGVLSPPSGTLLPGETFPSVWRLLVEEVGDLVIDVTVETDAGDLPFQVTAEGVPHLLDTPAEYGGSGGDNIDSASHDPLGAFRPTGFDPGSVFDVGDFDTVDVRSGNLVLALPLGGPFPVRGEHGYGFALTYNSNVWARRTIYVTSTTSSTIPPYNAEYPTPAANTGLGWTFTLGRLIPPVLDWDAYGGLPWQDKEQRVDTGPYWTYLGPDGAQRRFSKDLNHARNPHAPGQPGSGEPPTDDASDLQFLYARDGSHLRLRRVSESERHVEFPDGSRHVFRRFDEPVTSNPDPWRLVEMRGSFAAADVVTIVYDDLSWTISDPWRSHTVTFEHQPADEYYPVRVKTLELAPFDPGTPPQPRTYEFHYERELDVGRPLRSSFHFLPEIEPSRFFDVPLLTRITLPDDSEYVFSYLPQSPAGDEGLAPESLLLEEATLPTGGRLRWQYGTIQDTTAADCARGSSGPDGTGVVRRQAFDADGAALADVRYLRQPRRHPEDLPDGTDPDPIEAATCAAYVPRWAPSDGTPPPFQIRTPAPEIIVGVWTHLETLPEKALSSLGVHYFSVWPFAEYPDALRQQGWTKRERGLQLTRAPTNVTGGDISPNATGARLARELYSCPFDTSQAIAGDLLTPVGNLAELCSIEEAEYRRYELPAADLCESLGGKPCHVGARLVETETLDYTDLDSGDVPRRVRRTRSQYDGLGHHRRTVTTSNWPGHVERTEYRDYNPGLGPLELDDQGHVVPGTDVDLPTGSWILGTYGADWVEEAGVRMGGEACFDAANGRLRMHRTWQNAQRGSKDVIVRNAHNPQGELIVERFFGADTGDVPIGDGWCDADVWQDGDLGTLQDYAIEYSYQNGVVSEKRVVGESVHDVNRTIDAGTGWIETETLDSGEVIQHDYDEMGRRVSTTREHAADFTYHYDRLTDGRYQITVKTFPADQTSGATIREYVADLDGLGRVVRELIPGYDGAAVERTTRYHPSGNRRSVSSLDVPEKKTRFEWDARGRLRFRRQPNNTVGGSKDGLTAYEYRGVRQTTVKNWVDDASGVEQVAATVTGRDAYGRVVKVTLPEGAVTTYRHDPLGNTTRAQRGEQSRVWGSDGRGFVTSEEIPERSVTATFSEFNTRGQARELTEGDRTTRRVYDRLGRLTAVKLDNAPIKVFQFGSSPPENGQLRPENGRLIHAQRYNYRDAETGGIAGASGVYRVGSDYEYDPAGRVKRRTTSLTWDPDVGPPGDPMAFDQSWTYDDVGNVVTLDYPHRPGSATRQVTLDHAYGAYLTQVSTTGGLGAQLTYHPSGLVHVVDHDRAGVGSDTYPHDPDGVPRWSGMVLAGGTLDLSPVAYGPSGNITSTGGDTFLYDLNGRLVQAQVQGGSYDYAYDQYDNFAPLSGMGTVSSITNQLTGDVTYDAFGNLQESNLAFAANLVHDELDKVVAIHFGGAPSDPGYQYSQLQVYDHDDLRLLRYDHNQPGAEYTWTLRGLGGQVLRVFTGLGSAIQAETDYVYAGSRLLSSAHVGGEKRHYHSDHLGSARYVTVIGGPNREVHYRPFGGEIDSSGDPVAGFTGHENDGATTYMRARTYLPVAGRFLQVDAGRDSSAWSLYAYAANQPVRWIDPDGNQPDAPQLVLNAAGFMKMAGFALSFTPAGAAGFALGVSGNAVQTGAGASDGNLPATVGGAGGAVSGTARHFRHLLKLGTAGRGAIAAHPALAAAFAIDFSSQFFLGERPLPFIMGDASMDSRNRSRTPGHESPDVKNMTDTLKSRWAMADLRARRAERRLDQLRQSGVASAAQLDAASEEAQRLSTRAEQIRQKLGSLGTGPQ